MAQEIDIKFNAKVPDVSKPINQFVELRKAMVAARSELVNLEEGTEEFVTQAKKVGEIQDRINSLNDSIRNTSGAPIENLSSSFGMLQGQVSNLDFGGATTSLKQFGGSLGTLKFSDITKGAKEFGNTLLSVGRAMLTNPLFLIPAIIVGIGAALFALKDRVKVIGDAFAFFGRIIGEVVQGVKDFTDAIGLTTFAIDELADRTKKVADENFKLLSQASDNYIKKLEAEGKDTEAAYAERLKLIEDYYTKELSMLRNNLKEKKISQEEFDKQFEASSTALTNARVDSVLRGARAEAKARQEAEEAAKKAREARLADEAKLEAGIRAAEEEALLASIKNEEERAIMLATLKMEKRLEDIEATKASEKVKNDAALAAQLQFQTELNAIKKASDEKRLAEETRLADEERALRQQRKAESDALEQAAIQDLITRENAKFEQRILLEGENELVALEIRREQLEQQRLLEVELAERTGADIDTINTEYANKEIDLANRVAAEKKRLADEQVAAMRQAEQQGFAAAQNFAKAYFDYRLSAAQGNQEEELKIRKQAFQVEKAFNIARAVIDGARSVLAANIILPPAGQILATANAVFAASQVAVIASQQFNPGSTSASAPKAPSAPSVSASTTGLSPGAAPTPRAFDPDGNLGRTRRDGGSSQRVYVLESDIRETGEKVDLYESRATV